MDLASGWMKTNGQRVGPRPIIVLGAERSGTSVLAEMIHRWGAYAGAPDHIRPGDSQNPRGYWEYEPIWRMLLEVGDLERGASWWDASFEDRIRDKLEDERLCARASAMISDMSASGRPWVWKDPALSFFLPFWKAFWDDPVYVIAIRHPRDVAISWQRFVLPAGAQAPDGLLSAYLLRWQHVMSLILQHTASASHRLFVRYERVVAEPESQARRLARFLGKCTGGREALETPIRAMAEAVDPALWRNRSNRSFDTDAEATSAQKGLYRLLCGLVEEPYTPVDPSTYRMPDVWRETVLAAESSVAELCRKPNPPSESS